MGVLHRSGPALKRPMELKIHKILYLVLLFFAFFLVISCSFADDSNFYKYRHLPEYGAYKQAHENTRIIPIKLPIDQVPKEYSFDFSKEESLFSISDWKGLQQTPNGIKLKYQSRQGKKAYIPYTSSGSFVLDDLKLTSLGIIYAVEIDSDALVPEGTQVGFKVNDISYTGTAFLGKTNSANVKVTLSTNYDYLTPCLKSLDIIRYPIKNIQINPIILQTSGNSVQANLESYVTYYDFGYPNLEYSTDEKAGCNVLGTILTCNNLVKGTFYETLTVMDKITNLKSNAPMQIVVNSNSPYFTNLPTVNVQEDSLIAPMNLSPYISDPNNPISELSLSIDYIAPASGISCDLDSFTLSCSLEKDEYGTFAVMLKLEDPQGNTAFGDLKINVSNINDAPSWNSIPINSLEEGQTLNLNLSNFVSDVDTPSSTLYFEIKNNGGLNCNLVGPNLSCSTSVYPNSKIILVSTSDGQYEVDKEISVSWSKDNLAPVFTGPIIGKTSIGTALNYSKDISGMFSDPEGQELTYDYLVLSGSVICNIANKILNCSLSSQGYSDVKVTVSDGEKTTESNIFRLAKVSPADVTATVDVPHTVPLDYEVYFQVYVTNNLSIYLEGIEVTASSSELIIFDGDPVGHNTITVVLPKLEPNSVKESEFHTTVGNTEKTYNIMLMLNGQQLDSKQIETKDIFYAAGNGLVSMWQDMGDNDGAGFGSDFLGGKIPKDNKLKIRVHITSLYDVPLQDLNLCYVSQNGLLKPMKAGKVLNQSTYCQLVDIPALDELVIEQEVMPTEFGAEQQNFILGKGLVQYGSLNNLITGTGMGDFKVVTLSEGLFATWDELPDDYVLSKNTTYNLNVYLVNYFAVPIYNLSA